MQEWLLRNFEDGQFTRSELRAAMTDRRQAREMWVEFCDSDEFVDECQAQVERFLELLDDNDAI